MGHIALKDALNLADISLGTGMGGNGGGDRDVGNVGEEVQHNSIKQRNGTFLSLQEPGGWVTDARLSHCGVPEPQHSQWAPSQALLSHTYHI